VEVETDQKRRRMQNKKKGPLVDKERRIHKGRSTQKKALSSAAKRGQRNSLKTRREARKASERKILKATRQGTFSVGEKTSEEP